MGTTANLSAAISGDRYEWTARFPTGGTELDDAPDNVIAQLRRRRNGPVLAEWTVTKPDPDVLHLVLDPVDLKAGIYLHDLQVAGRTYITESRFVVRGDISQ